MTQARDSCWSGRPAQFASEKEIGTSGALQLGVRKQAEVNLSHRSWAPIRKLKEG
jgi:hypothetical protein